MLITYQKKACNAYQTRGGFFFWGVGGGYFASILRNMFSALRLLLKHFHRKYKVL